MWKRKCIHLHTIFHWISITQRINLSIHEISCHTASLYQPNTFFFHVASRKEPIWPRPILQNLIIGVFYGSPVHNLPVSSLSLYIIMLSLSIWLVSSLRCRVCQFNHYVTSFIYLPYSGQPYIYYLFNFFPQLITITSTTRM